jgi:opacity protein-like surface antigen
MRKQLKLLAGLLSLWIVAVSSSQAQVRKGFELGFYAGAGSAKNDDKTRVVDGRRAREIDASIDDGIIAGVRAGYNFSRLFALELSVGGTTNNYIVRLRSDGSLVSTEDTNALFFLHGNGMLHLTKGRVVPFVTGGAGAGAFIDKPALTANYGGGLKVFLTERFALRLDFRQYHTRLEDTIEQVVLSRTGLSEIPEPYSDRFRFREVTAGFSFNFGRR